MLDFTGLCLISLTPVLGLNDLYLFSLDSVGSHWPVLDLIALFVGLTCLCWVPLVSMRFSLICVAFHWSVYLGSHLYPFWVSLVSMLDLIGLCCIILICVGSHWSLCWFHCVCWVSIFCVGFQWSLLDPTGLLVVSHVSVLELILYFSPCFVSLVSVLGLICLHVGFHGLPVGSH